MRHLIIILAVCLIGCAAPQQKVQVVKNTDPSHNRVKSACLPVYMQANPEHYGEYRYAIIVDNNPNAWMQGKDLILTSKLVGLMNDKQLSCVCAHEAAHDILNHRRKQQALSGGITAGMMVVGAIIPGAGLLNHAVNPIATRTFSRSQEIDADTKAIELLKGLDIGSEVYASMLSNLKLYGEIMGEKDKATILSTHPALEERIKRAEGRE